MMDPMKLLNLKKFLDLGVWIQETTFGPLDLKDASRRKYRKLASFFTNITSFLKNHRMNPIKL